MRPGKLAPLLKILGFAEIHHVVLDGFPAHDQSINGRPLDHALQAQAVATLGSLEQRSRFGDCGFEGGFLAGLGFDLGNLKNHSGTISVRGNSLSGRRVWHCPAVKSIARWTDERSGARVRSAFAGAERKSLDCLPFARL